MEAILISGCVTGVLYALAGLGIVVIYRSSQVVNFAQGDVATAATFVAYTLLARNLPYPLAFLASIAFAFVLAYALDALLLRRMKEQPVLNIVTATIALSLILNGLNGAIWGYSTQSMPPPNSNLSFQIGTLDLPASEIFALVIAVAFIVALFVFFQYTKAGTALRAMFQNPLAASCCGVDVDRLRSVSWGIAGVLGAVAGLFITPTLYLDPNVLDYVMVTAFGVVVLGGFTSIPGVIVSGLILGVLSNLLSVYVSTSFENTLTFLVVLLILSVRPRGLFGAGPVRKF